MQAREGSGAMASLLRMDAAAVRRFLVLTRAALASHRTEIDELNVYPVPDGDTGTNLYLTLDRALEVADWQLDPPDLARSAAALTEASLRSARGNSGIILSQLVRGFAEVVARAPRDGLGPAELASGLRRAAELARSGVSRPAEGTILTVADAAAAAAGAAAASGSALLGVATVALEAGRSALAATTDQLGALNRAGVVDAGGAGFVLVLESLERVVRGDVPDEPRSAARPAWHRTPGAAAPADLAGSAGPAGSAGTEADGSAGTEADGSAVEDLRPAAGVAGGPAGGPAYEVMYLLEESDEELAAALRERLQELGDSVLVVGGPPVWTVHAHVDDPGAAVEAGIDAGRPRRVAITHFGDQAALRRTEDGARGEPADPDAGGLGVTLVAFAAGPGLRDVYEQAGAVVAEAPADAAGVLAAVEAADGPVLVLPGDPATLAAARAVAAALDRGGARVKVVAAAAPVQVVAALTVLQLSGLHGGTGGRAGGAAEPEPSAPLGGLARVAAETVSAMRCGSVRLVEEGAVAVADGEEVASGEDVDEVARQLLATLLGGPAGSPELLTLVTGRQARPGLGESLARAVAAGLAGLPAETAEVEVVVVDGGQADPLLVAGVE